MKNCTCYYFDNIIEVRERDRTFDFNDILLDNKLYKEKDENILIYDILYKILMNAKSLHFRFNKIDGFDKTNNGIRCLLLFDYGWYDRIEYLIRKKSGITNSINHNFGKSELIHMILYLLKKY